MPIYTQISADMKTAMKAKDADTLQTLRMLKSAIDMKAIAKGGELTEEENQAVLRTYVKQQEEGRESFAAGGRADMAEKATAEIALVKKYLPTEMTEEELEKIIKAKVLELNATAKDFGKLMGAVMKETQGRADGAKVGALIKKMVQ
ncbi:MAG: GatB/YqeY domain-containing protein [bacterium]